MPYQDLSGSDHKLVPFVKQSAVLLKRRSGADKHAQKYPSPLHTNLFFEHTPAGASGRGRGVAHRHPAAYPIGLQLRHPCGNTHPVMQDTAVQPRRDSAAEPAAHAITRRCHVACFISSVLLCVLSVINHYVYLYSGEPLLFYDLHELPTALNILGSYRFRLGRRTDGYSERRLREEAASLSQPEEDSDVRPDIVLILNETFYTWTSIPIRPQIFLFWKTGTAARMSTARLPLSPYYQSLLALSREIPIRLKDGRYIATDGQTGTLSASDSRFSQLAVCLDMEYAATFLQQALFIS